VRRVSRFAIVSWSILSLGGCAAISGLDQIQESECAPNCDGGGGTPLDATTVDSPEPTGDGAQPGSDSTVDTSDDSSEQPDSASDDSSGGNDSGPDGDAQVKTDAGDASEGGAHDAGVDAPHDAGSDSACGPTNTTQNCGACGRSCSTLGASSTTCASNGTCTPTCSSGFLSCSNPAAPTADNGCECSVPNATGTPACCGALCPVAHDNGLGTINSTFYDCVAAGTMNLQLAMDACISVTGSAAQCQQAYCINSMDASTGEQLVCTSGTNCTCWAYTNPNQGYVDTGCHCPDPSYDTQTFH
jgi:hypothetical protein